MKNQFKLICLAMSLAVSTQLIAQEPGREMSEKEKSWMAYMTPGPIHEMIARYNGEWNAEITMWMEDGAEPSKSTGSATNYMIMGGRYQESVYKGTFNEMPFEGKGIWGYDNAKKKFVSTWIDNFGTGVMYMEGTWDDASKTAHLSGQCIDPETGKEMSVREVFKMVDDNTQIFEMYDTKDGKERKTMEIKYTRKGDNMMK